MPVMSRVESAFCRSAPWTEFARRAMVPWALHGERLQGDVLELGCGSGAMAEAIARDFPDVTLVATDLDPKMVAVTERRLARYPNAKSQVADVANLPFDDKSFDVVTSFLMLHHVVDWQAAISEVKRVLRPGRRFRGYDLNATLGAKAIHVADRSPYRLVDPAEIRTALHDVGFASVKVRRALGNQAYRFVADNPE